MRILVLGGTGMLGHKAYQVFGREWETFVTMRAYNGRLKDTRFFDPDHVIEGVDAFAFDTVDRAITQTRPQIVLNAIGIIKQSDEAHDPRSAIYVNTLFPHLLAEACTKHRCKLIHISTDCVFSGTRGHDHEEDIPDALDLYGRSKFLGEVGTGGHLTLRTSIIGHELFSRLGLVEWFLAQRGKSVNGFTNAVFSGLTTLALSREIARLIRTSPGLSGLFQVSAGPIDKYHLLSIIQSIYGADVCITPFSGFICDRSLNSDRYRNAVGFVPQSWEAMVTEMHEEYHLYEQWRQQ